MDKITDTLICFNTTTLEELNVIKLLNRYDTKFIFHREQLLSVIDLLSEHYKVLDINGRRCFKYKNLYYDTDDYFFYRQHHNRKFARYKVRCRKYIDTNQCFFEVKYKNNKKKTIKSRILLEDNSILHELTEELKSFARKSILLNNGDVINQVKPKLEVEFDRFTFANYTDKERITVDINLTFTDKNSFSRKIDNLVIAELKSEKYSFTSSFVQYLKGLIIYPTRFSKYCIGIALTEENIKYNRFKKKLNKLNQLNQGKKENAQ